MYSPILDLDNVFVVKEVEDDVIRIVNKDPRVELQEVKTDVLDHTIRCAVQLRILPRLGEDELYAKLVKDVQMTKRDFTESAVFQLVQKGNVQATLYANRINKDRGYSDSMEHTGAEGEPIKWVEIKTYEGKEE